MKTFILMLLFFHLSSSVKHSLVFFSIGFSGTPDFPDFFGTVEVDGIQSAYCDSDKTIKPKQHWLETLLQNDPGHFAWYKGLCFEIQPNSFKDMINNLMQASNQSEGVHILQRISGCEWDDETGEVDGFVKYAYDREDILSFDVKRLTWIAQKPEALKIKSSWNEDKTRLKYDENNLIQVFPKWLKKYLDAGRSSLMRTVPPSVSLLQKSPSSPVTCHATGFFPDRAVMFWRRDGVKLSKNVNYREILPNHDGTFQMSVDLNINTEFDSRRYECVFQLHGLKEDQVEKLIKDPTALIVGVVLLTVLLVAVVVGVILYKKRKATKTRTEGSETHNSETIPMKTPS